MFCHLVRAIIGKRKKKKIRNYNLYAFTRGSAPVFFKLKSPKNSSQNIYIRTFSKIRSNLDIIGWIKALLNKG